MWSSPSTRLRLINYVTHLWGNVLITKVNYANAVDTTPHTHTHRHSHSTNITYTPREAHFGKMPIDFNCLCLTESCMPHLMPSMWSTTMTTALQFHCRAATAWAVSLVSLSLSVEASAKVLSIAGLRVWKQFVKFNFQHTWFLNDSVEAEADRQRQAETDRDSARQSETDSWQWGQVGGSGGAWECRKCPVNLYKNVSIKLRNV